MSAGTVQVPLKPSSGRSPPHHRKRQCSGPGDAVTPAKATKEGPELHLLMLSGYQIKLTM